MAARKFGMHSLHVKNSTKGTSNEISLSVLDAKKQQKDAELGEKHGNALGKVALFSLPGKKKKIKGAPQREEGLPLPSGDFATGAAEHDPTGTVSLGSNAISGGTVASGFTEDFSGSSSTLGQSEKHGLLSGNKKKGIGQQAGHNHVPTAEEKQAKARSLRRIGIAGAACIIIAVAAFGVYTLVRGYHENYLLNQSYQQVLTSALAEVVEADDILSQMDSSFEDMLGEDSLKAMEAVQDKLPTATTHLDKAQDLVQRVQPSLTDVKDVAAAKSALDTIEVRRSMLSEGSAIVDEALNVAKEEQQLTNAWNALLAADSLVRQAVTSLSPLDVSTVSPAKEKAQQARTGFENALSLFTALSKTYLDLNLSVYSSYASLRIDALDHYIALCDAIDVEDTDLATTENDEYNSCDASAVALANGFVSDITTLATDSFFKEVDQFRETYTADLKTAASLDADLREYLRTTSSQ